MLQEGKGALLKTKRWNDPQEPDDGFRLLVCRYRPRGVKREDEPWDAWLPHLGPSVELHDAAYGKSQPAISWAEYTERYRQEMTPHALWIRGFGRRALQGETITLLCSSACVDAQRCHRTLLRALMEEAASPPRDDPASSSVVRRRTRMPS